MKSGDRVSFDSGGSRLAAHLFLPDSFDPEKSYPAVVVVRPATGVKEQTAGLYAARLATHGFVTLAFDPRGFGGSDGRPLLEDPRRIIEDTRSGVTFVEGLGFVNPRHLFLAGVCMGGAYAPSAASEDDRIRAVASITPYLTLHLDYPARFVAVPSRSPWPR